MEWSLNPKAVLTPFFADDNWDLPGLIELLPKLPWRLRAADRWAIKAFQHDLRKFITDPQSISEAAVRLRVKCASAGTLGLRLLAPLRAVIDVPTAKGIEDLLEEADKSSRNDFRSLERFCAEQEGLFDVDPELHEPVEFISPEERGSSQDLPFDLFHLELAVDALRHNLEKLLKQQPDNPSPQSVVSARLTVDRLSVAYLDNSPGFANIEHLARELRVSLKDPDALDRGLPLALSFPLYYPFADLAFLSQDGVWVSLANDEPSHRRTSPSAGEAANAGTKSRFRFGVRWAFRLEQREGAFRQ